MKTADLLEILERRGIITRQPIERVQCCGLDRDKDGFCVYRSHHPIFVESALTDTPEIPFPFPSKESRMGPVKTNTALVEEMRNRRVRLEDQGILSIPLDILGEYVVRRGLTPRGTGCYLVVTTENIGWSPYQNKATRFESRNAANRAVGWLRCDTGRPVRLRSSDMAIQEKKT